MTYRIDDTDYEVVIQRKNNKNLYIRMKEDMKIYVSCNYLMTNHAIEKILNENDLALRKMLKSVNKKKEKEDKFFYLGKSYDIIINENIKRVYMEDNTIYTPSEKVLLKWLKDETIRIFDLEYVKVFNNFKEDIKSPILKIRDMKTRWGVYNKKNHTITLNSRLIEFDIDKIDYVIVHELSHIKHFDHSKSFWTLVSKYCQNYKEIRKEMKD